MTYCGKCGTWLNSFKRSSNKANSANQVVIVSKIKLAETPAQGGRPIQTNSANQVLTLQKKHWRDATIGYIWDCNIWKVQFKSGPLLLHPLGIWKGLFTNMTSLHWPGTYFLPGGGHSSKTQLATFFFGKPVRITPPQPGRGGPPFRNCG